MKPSHYHQVMGDKSPIAKLVRQADQDVQERVKAARELEAQKAQEGKVSGVGNIVARWSASGIVIRKEV